METERFERLVVVMSAMAAGDKAAVFSLYSDFWTQLAASIRRELRRLGVEHPHPEELDGMVIDACLVLLDCGGAWKPEGGALPWTWAQRRLAGVVSDWVGQYADELDADRADSDGDDGRAAAAGGDDEPELDVLLRMASRHARCALALEALELVASRRDQAIVLELRCQIAAGDPSPALTVAARHNVSGEVVRKAASRVRERLNRLAAEEQRFVGLADLALVA